MVLLIPSMNGFFKKIISRMSFEVTRYFSITEPSFSVIHRKIKTPKISVGFGFFFPQVYSGALASVNVRERWLLHKVWVTQSN